MRFYKGIAVMLICFMMIGCQKKSEKDLANRTIIEPETEVEKEEI